MCIRDRGTDIMGATFAGAPCILIGTNRNLAWTHTVNYPDKADVFKLQMHPKKRNVYYFENQEKKLEVKKASIYTKILGLTIKIKR